jgi:hypothetical protein
MAVIREKRQFMNQPIGVVRADLGGDLVAKGVGQLADTLIQGSFKNLVEDAQQEGAELAQSMAASKLRTINPETGEPEAFATPSQFGRSASKAYQAVIERRYVTETEQDLKAESARIYAETYLKPNGFEEYSTRFRSYAESITENALPRFQQVVAGMSGSLVASTELDFIKRKADSDRQNESFALQEAADRESVTLTQTISAVPDFSDPIAQQDLRGLIEGLFQAQRNGLESTVYDARIYSAQENKLITGISTGIKNQINATYLATQNSSNPLTLEDIKSAEMSINAGGQGIDSVDERLRPFVEFAQSFAVNLSDADGNIEERNFSSVLSSALAKDLTSLYQDANQLKQLKDANLSDESTADALSWQTGLFDAGPEGGLNQSVEKMLPFINQGAYETVSSMLNAETARITEIAQKKNESAGKTVVARDTINSAQRMLRVNTIKKLVDRLYQSVIPTTTEDGKTILRPLNVRESSAIEAYLDGQRGGVQLSDLPQSVQSLVSVIEKETTNTVKDNIGRYVGQKDTDLGQDYSRAQSDSNASIALANTLNGSGTNNAQNRKGMDRAFNIPEIGNYFLTQEGEDQFPRFAQAYVTAGFVGENLLNTAQAVAGGGASFNSEQIVRFFKIYDNIRNEAAALGHTVTPWDVSLSSEEVATLDAVNEVIKNSAGTLAAPQVYSTMMENLSFSNRQEFNQRMLQVTGSFDGMSMLKDMFETNIAARTYFQPLVKYYVAGGMNKDLLEKTINNAFERQFIDTEGYVVDPSGGRNLGESFRSAFSWAKFIPSRSNRITAARNINTYLKSQGINAYIPRQERFITEMTPLGSSLRDANILDRADIGIDKNATPVFLYPVAGNATGSGEDVGYQLVTIENGTMSIYMHKQDVNGTLVERPVYFNMIDIKNSLRTETEEEMKFNLDNFAFDPSQTDLYRNLPSSMLDDM